MAEIKLEIVTPEKKVYDGAADAVNVPTATGEIGILPNHAPLISSLKPGILTVTGKGTTEKMVVAGGFVEVSANKVSVLTDIAETAAEINVEAARAEREAAEKALGGTWSGTAEAFDAEKEKLERAQARLALAAGR
ncbi:MAG: ATP synthase F1 subunit epsilon [Acidobacteria bacterium]|nr:ATP synthase F1 subunit epsilon [Acidobacteriota bacterium]